MAKRSLRSSIGKTDGSNENGMFRNPPTDGSKIGRNSGCGSQYRVERHEFDIFRAEDPSPVTRAFSTRALRNSVET